MNNPKLKVGDRVLINDFGVCRRCVVATMPRELAFRVTEWRADRLYLRDDDGRYFPIEMPRWESTR